MVAALRQSTHPPALAENKGLKGAATRKGVADGHIADPSAACEAEAPEAGAAREAQEPLVCCRGGKGEERVRERKERRGGGGG